MKKIMVLCFVLIFLFSSTTVMAAKVEDEIPTKVKVISQSGMAEGLCLTVIDLECNEVVILFYYRAVSGLIRGKLQLSNVVRTGMFVDPDEQVYVIGQDAPFGEEKNQGTNQNNYEQWPKWYKHKLLECKKRGLGIALPLNPSGHDPRDDPFLEDDINDNHGNGGNRRSGHEHFVFGKVLTLEDL